MKRKMEMRDRCDFHQRENDYYIFESVITRIYRILSMCAVLKFTIPVIRTRLLRNVYFSLLRSMLSRDINLHNLQCGAHAILRLIEARISLPWANTKFHIPPTRLVTRFPWTTLRSREIFLLSDNESSCMLYPSVIYQPVIILESVYR